MNEVLDDAVLCIRQKRMDNDVMYNFTQEIERIPDSKVLVMRKLSEALGLVQVVSESESESEASSSGTSFDDSVGLPLFEDSRPSSSLEEEEALVFFRFALVLLTSIRASRVECSRDFDIVAWAWTALALEWCTKYSLLELHTVLQSFLVTACLTQTEVGSHHSHPHAAHADANRLLDQLTEVVLDQFSNCLTLVDQSLELCALMSCIKEKPRVFYSLVESKVVQEESNPLISPLQRHAMIWILIGNVVTQPWFDPRTFTSSSLWHSMLRQTKSSKEITFQIVGLWFFSIFLPASSNSVSSFVNDLLQSLQQAIWLCTDGPHSQIYNSFATQPSPSNVSNNVMVSLFHLSGQIPVLNSHEIQHSFSVFMDHFNSSRNASLVRSYRVPDALSQMSFDDNPAHGYGIHQVELWLGPASSTTGDDGIRALRVTLQDEFAGLLGLPLRGDFNMQHDIFTTKHVLTLAPDEYITQIDVSCYEFPPTTSKLLQRRRTFIGALRFTTTKREYPWIGKPSRQTHLDYSIQNDRFDRSLPHAKFDTEVLSQEVNSDSCDDIVGLFGSFDEGLLRTLGATFVERTLPRTSNHIISCAMSFISFVFRCIYALDPWRCLKFFHDEQQRINKTITKALFLQVRLHPGILQDVELNRVDFQTCVEWLACHQTNLNGQNTKEDTSRKHPLIDRFEVHAGEEMRSMLHSLSTEVKSMGEWEAKDWWTQRELHVEKEIARCLHKRMQVQRSKIHAYEKERKKWERDAQLRISKYSSDRKLSSEQNMELQTQIKALELKLERTERELQQHTARSVQLEGKIEEQLLHIEQLQCIGLNYQAMKVKLAGWEEDHYADWTHKEETHIREIESMKHKWRQAYEKASVKHESHHVAKHVIEHDDSRVVELEKALKQKVRPD
ncbi:Aste57867_22563 [Aphanomyces stellatus]|uniref:Aste57867_22563 protein n=1 Tax=Aphanomyces stellatus TaxID=120398 RepID=A0A485LLQ3_9STRA|nr:hypothetical protein As57867_022493 [Aphanomyces stellatus]VFT99222.1 Aste57867_22563 [Aphanomyces stellatus]